jgi:predicted  nucleic acid-binding Zn-ribbon protein
MSQTLSLYRLQQIDSQMDHLRARLQEIQNTLDNDAELRQLNELIVKADARDQAAEHALRQAERDVESQLIKIEQTQSDLYGGKSHSPKELQDLQNDVAALKRYLVILEDRQIDAMQESETAEAEQKFAHAKVSAALDIRVDLGKDLRQEQETINNELERFLIEYNAVSGAIPATDLVLYNQLRQRRRGVAVAVIGDNACRACGSTLSLAQIQSARSSDRMMLCPSCGRILYGN